jgi:hypothetical protein
LVRKPTPSDRTLRGLFEYFATQSCPPSLAFEGAWRPPVCWRDSRSSFYASIASFRMREVRERLPTYHSRDTHTLCVTERRFAYFEVSTGAANP